MRPRHKAAENQDRTAAVIHLFISFNEAAA